MSTDAAPVSAGNKNPTLLQTPALGLISVFVILIAAFLLHFNLLYAPLQGADFALFFFDDVYHTPGTALQALERMPGAPLAAFSLGVCRRLGGGTVMFVRTFGMILLALAAIQVFQLLRTLLADRESVAAPLAGALLFIVSPAVAGALGESPGISVLMAVCFALAAAVSYLNATKTRFMVDWLYLVLACICLAAAFAAHHGMIILPAALVTFDMLRLDGRRRPRLTPSLTGGIVLTAAAGTLGAVAYVSGAALPPLSPLFVFGGYSLAAIALPWLIGLLPASAPRYAAGGLASLLIIVGAVLSFMQGFRYVDPMAYLEQDVREENNHHARRQLALHYLHAATRDEPVELRIDLLREAVALWPDDADEFDARFRLRAAAELLALGDPTGAVTLVAPVLERTPMTAFGHRAALMLARAYDKTEHALHIADLYAFAGRRETPQPEDVLRHGLVLSETGNIVQAAAVFDFAPPQPENSYEDMMMQQSQMARRVVHSLRDRARQQLMEDPIASDGYVSSGEAELAGGNFIRAYYWFNLAMRRDQEAERAWEMMGLIFARHDQAEMFIERWAHVKKDQPEVWVALARQAALAQSWDAALAYVYQADVGEAPLPEEYLAIFAIEMQRMAVAEQWLARAAEAHPEAFSPWLLKADIAIARQQKEEALGMLEEAGRRNAPQEELDKRKERLDAMDAAPRDDERPFEPVRSIIQ